MVTQLLTGLRDVISSLISSLAAQNDKTINELRAKVEELESENSELKQGVEEIITEFSPDISDEEVVNPSPSADAVIQAADDLDVANTPEVDAAVELIGTDKPIPQEALDSAAEMLADAAIAEGAGE